MAPFCSAIRIKVSLSFSLSLARCTQKKNPPNNDPTPSHPSTHSTGAQPTECTRRSPTPPQLVPFARDARRLRRRRTATAQNGTTRKVGKNATRNARGATILLPTVCLSGCYCGIIGFSKSWISYILYFLIKIREFEIYDLNFVTFCVGQMSMRLCELFLRIEINTNKYLFYFTNYFKRYSDDT